MAVKTISVSVEVPVFTSACDECGIVADPVAGEYQPAVDADGYLTGKTYCPPEWFTVRQTGLTGVAPSVYCSKVCAIKSLGG